MAATAALDALSLDLPFMDEAHGRFMGLLAIADSADDRNLPDAWRDLVACASESFAREDSWMDATGHASRRDHHLQHRVVLEVMREGMVLADEGQWLHVRQMAWQLRDWYCKHVQTMDAALALHLRGTRFAPDRAAAALAAAAA
ncbi:hemerythrin [Variovorax sp. J2P1-59]|uniref:bacteriohemerythrin n=1 Tax=Variovorax flavidus TaxID=3053501 RepID=UPI0025777D87|nr:hemerythrin [Variovorax sp. J2P1-59]MDM0075361.1 hemerythrin [Variovorax sp. J2P1-59]